MTGHTRPRSLRWASIAAGAACALSAQAQQAPSSSTPSGTGPSPYSIGMSETLTHESNLFRDSSDEQADWVSVTGLNFGLDQMLGRQRLHGLASLQLNRYRDRDELNNTGHDVHLALDWETIADLSGVLGVQSTRKQYQFGLDSALPSNEKNIESTDAAFLQGKLGGMGQYELLAGANALRRDYSASAFASQEFSQWGFEGGGGWHPGPDLRSALVARYTRISRPNVVTDPGPPPVVLFGDDVARRDLELSLGWQASGASHFDLRVARSHELHSVWDDRSFWTGSIAWDWVPSGKLRFTTRLLRDTEGISGNLASAEATLPANPAGDQLRDAFEWTGQWAATPKISVVAAAQYSRRRLTGLGLVDNVLHHAVDRTTSLSLGMRYSPLRSLDLTCDLHNETRDTNTTDFTLTRPYDSLTVGCGLQFWLR
jgi:hypothetical protein